MTSFLASTGFWELSSTSVLVAGISALVALVTASAATIQAWHEAKMAKQAMDEYLAISRKIMVIKRRGTNKTVELPKHYTPEAAQELLDLLA
jgi:uncharacterized protein YcaQ